MALRITDEQNYQDIADAIRNKLGSDDTFLPSEMAGAIGSIPSGGNAEVKTIFIDYDGTVLHEYTQAEVDALTALPALPSHDGLTCQGWNWTLSELQALGRAVVVGANYVTDDGKTRVYISIPENDLYVKTQVGTSMAFTAIVDWGDGNSSTLSKSSNSAEHTYSAAGDYVITFEVLTGTMTISGSSSLGSTLVYSGQSSSAESMGAINYIRKIELGENIVLGSYVFKYTRNMESISIPEGIQSFPASSFSAALNLKGIVLPREAVQLDTFMFYECLSLRYISIPPTLASIPESFVSGCIGLSRVSFPDSVTLIYENAFKGCISLEGVELPSYITGLGKNAFNGVMGLKKNLVLPQSVTTVSNYALAETNIETLVINSAITAGPYAFSSNKRLRSVKFNAGFTELKNNVFSSCDLLEELEISGSGEEIQNSFVYKDSVLTEVILPDTITKIGEDAFGLCMSLKEIDIPSSVTEIGPYAFYSCHGIRQLSIPEGVTRIESYSYNTMKALTEIEFLGDIEFIDRYAFTSSYGIVSVDLTHCTAVPELAGTNAFVSGSTRLKIKVPAALYDEWIAAVNWSSISQYIVAA